LLCEASHNRAKAVVGALVAAGKIVVFRVVVGVFVV
jgi:hypothetical protein